MTTNPSGFDPSAFLGATMTEANTRRPPIPAGTALPGTLGEPKMRQTEGTKDTNRGVIYTFLEIPVELDLTSNSAVRQRVGQDKVTLIWSTSVDLTPTGFDMSAGKNNGLRQLREALGMNQPGAPFNLLMVQGRPVLAMIKNEPYQGEVYDKIASLASVG